MLSNIAVMENFTIGHAYVVTIFLEKFDNRHVCLIWFEIIQNT